nr:hypothetical protein [Sedimentibacter sp.]
MKKSIKLIIICAVGLLILYVILKVINPSIKENEQPKTNEQEQVSDIKGNIDESSNEISNEQEEKIYGETQNSIFSKYITFSNEGNIDIIVDYLSPRNGDIDNLVFNVSLGTHSIDLSSYQEISKYIEFRTDKGIIINDGFEWELKNNDIHHINGVLTIKNEFNGNKIINSETEFFSLVFSDVGNSGERVHLYNDDKLY